MNFKIVDGIVNWDDGSSRPASYEELVMWNRIERSESAYDSLHKDYIQAVQEVRIAHENHHESVEQLQAEVERLKSDESVPACVWAEDPEGNWDTKCGDKHYLTAGTPFENGMHWCCYCGASLLEELYGEQAND